MKPKQLTDEAKKHLADLTGFKNPAGIGLRKEKGGWVVIVEIVEKKSIPDGMDVLGTYEVCLDNQGNLLNYKRTDLRKRTDTALRSEQ